MNHDPLHQDRRTKIIATLGPATDAVEKLMELFDAGVNMVRLNFSHGSHAEHKQRIEMVREAASKSNRIIGLLGDLQGPKIRVANFKNGKVQLKKGDVFTLDADLGDEVGDETAVGIDYKELPRDVKKQDVLLLDDGRIQLIIDKVDGNKIICKVSVGGKLSNHKGINRLGGGLSAPALTDKDIDDLQFALKQKVDYVAVSFVRHARDVQKAQDLISAYKGDAGVIAKIERIEAVKNIEEIIQACDGVMVARGDLAVEIGDAEVPGVQKRIIHMARTLNKPVITATQMMESMISSPVPTRAEVSDVANAVIDYTDAVMLSAESAVGDYPIESVAAMARTCLAAEQQPRSQISHHRLESHFERIDEAIAMATMYTANHLNIEAIISLTESGKTALWMSRIRSAIPIYALSRYYKTLGRLTLYRGVHPLFFDPTQCTRDDVNSKAVEATKQFCKLSDDDLVILTKGDHMGIGGGSNAMKILQVGSVI